MNLISEWFGDSANQERTIQIFVPKSKTKAFASTEEANKFVSSVNADCYFGVGLMRPVAKGRGKATDCVGIGGLWCDLDWRSTKQGKPLAGNVDTLLDFIRKTIPIKPSVVVNSGGGFHLYWIFKEPWIFESETERQYAAKLSHDWHGWIIRQAPAWQLENCGDLPRVLRVPGTLNFKYGEPVPCEIFESNDLRFIPDDFDDFCDDQQARKTVSVKRDAPKIEQSPAEIKFKRLYDSGGEFRLSFDHERSDLFDQSPSGYDLSLCTIAAANSWTDNEIAWLISHHRNFWGDKPEKADRPDYVSRTIFKARESAIQMRSHEMNGSHSEDIDLSGILNQDAETRAAVVNTDPGPTPEHLLFVPGFINDLTEYTLATAPYPNRPLAFVGALAMQSLIAARRVRDAMNCRTNLYLLALAHSGSGKDWPRKVNVRLAYLSGILDSIGDRFASGEGLEDALAANPAMLFQTDEIDAMLQTIGKAKDGRGESIMASLLNFYSQSNCIYRTRRKAGKEGASITVTDPSLTLLGTAIPKHYYDAINERMLSNGFFARVLTFDAGHRGEGQTVSAGEIPQHLIERVRAWKTFNPSAGNLISEFPSPFEVPETKSASTVFSECQDLSDSEYRSKEELEDEAGMSIWARTWERARKLALIYACSACQLDSLQIDENAAKWGCELSVHQTRQTLHRINLYRADNDFAAKQTRLLGVLRQFARDCGPDAWMQFRLIGQKLRWPPKEHDQIRESLIQTEQIETRLVKTNGRPRYEYRAAKGRTK